MDWANEKAREWLECGLAYADYEGIDLMESTTSLAALLRDVGGHYVAHVHFYDHDAIRAALLAEVRRVVLMVKAETDRPGLCDEILSRLEKLK